MVAAERGVNGLFTVMPCEQTMVRGGVNLSFTPCRRGDARASHHHEHVWGTPGDHWGQRGTFPQTRHTCIHTASLIIPNGGSTLIMVSVSSCVRCDGASRECPRIVPIQLILRLHERNPTADRARSLFTFLPTPTTTPYYAQTNFRSQDAGNACVGVPKLVPILAAAASLPEHQHAAGQRCGAAGRRRGDRPCS